MIPPVFALLAADNAVTTLIGTNPVKCFHFGEAPQGVSYPYVTFFIFHGAPENTLDKVPVVDKLGTQIDIWGTTSKSALDTAAAVRDALEPHAHMVGTGDTIRDPETKAFRVRLDFDFYTER